jgi:hypothetical protein
MKELKEIGFWSNEKEAKQALCEADNIEISILDTSVPDNQFDEKIRRVNKADARPNPLELVDPIWFKNASIKKENEVSLLEKLDFHLNKRCFIESYEMGYSFCRFDCDEAKRNPRIMGACTLTDGTYCWPEGYWHYIQRHQVKPNDDLIDHVVKMYANKFQSENEADRLLLWDPVLQQAQPIPLEMQTWIIQNTTISRKTNCRIHDACHEEPIFTSLPCMGIECALS